MKRTVASAPQRNSGAGDVTLTSHNVPVLAPHPVERHRLRTTDKSLGGTTRRTSTSHNSGTKGPSDLWRVASDSHRRFGSGYVSLDSLDEGVWSPHPVGHRRLRTSLSALFLHSTTELKSLGPTASPQLRSPATGGTSVEAPSAP